MRLLAPVPDIAPADADWEGDGAAAVVCRPGAGPPQWLRAPGWRLFASPSVSAPAGTAFASFECDDGRIVRCVLDGDGRAVIPFGLAEAYAGYTAERYAAAAGGRRLPEGTLDAFYRLKSLVPRRLQIALRRALIRWQGLPDFPSWPIDVSVARLLGLWVRAELLARGERELRFRWFWPERAAAALVLTHDVESADGLRNAVRIADLEEAHGLRSSFNVVAAEYPIDWGIVDELAARGFEIGIHGVFHDRSMFSGREEFVRQQPALRATAARLGAEGFRSPATHRVHGWLAELPVSYDCTIPLSDPYEPQPGGCCSPWPYFLGDVVELPWTLPQDNTIFTLLKHRSIEPWTRQVAALERSHGLVQCLTHPDPGYLARPDRLTLYEEFLAFVSERDGLWHALPREVAAWWRARDSARGPVATGSAGVARLDGERVDLAVENVNTNSRPRQRDVAVPSAVESDDAELSDPRRRRRRHATR